ncbi:hypothetical protein [Actinomadura parmotrematis]|uniref:Secreted protein n=1 Tax=Actinomadura parmotrematis TaxID=2864039 RepID=A0ABS7G764_9ACTN|nr:hypothetical protein [Actinomadura parmotrematis]MBW8487704.1 hypothetical protein [Actinomadura parmotrematis]
MIRPLGVAAALVLTLVPAPAASAAGEWRSVASPFVPGGKLTGVAAAAPDDAWAVGAYYRVGSTVFDYPQAVMQRWTGSGWQGRPIPGQVLHTTLDAVAAVSPSDAWAVGGQSDLNGLNHPYFIHWNGTAWSEARPPDWEGGSASGGSVDAAGPGDVWVSNSLGHVWHLTGGTWRTTDVRLGFEFQTTRIRAAGTGAWVAGRHQHWDGTWSSYPDTARWDGTAWVEHPVAVWPDTATVRDVLPVASGDVWAVGRTADGDDTPLLARWDGTAWHNVPVPAGTASLTSLAPDGQGGAYAAGKAADTSGAPAVLRLGPGGTATRVAVPQSAGTPNAELTALATAPGTGTVWGVGTSRLGTLVMTNH